MINEEFKNVEQQINYRNSWDENSGYCEECYCSFMIYMESRTKNSILITVDLKTLETIERLFGKPASSERAT